MLARSAPDREHRQVSAGFWWQWDDRSRLAPSQPGDDLHELVGLDGLRQMHLKPASRARSASSGRAYAVRAAAGRSSGLVVERTARINSYPSRPGHADIRDQNVRVEGAECRERRFHRRRGGDLCLAVAEHAAKQVEACPARRRPRARADRSNSHGERVISVAASCSSISPSGMLAGSWPCRGATRGSRTVNVAPRFKPALVAATVPPCNSTRAFASESPSPRPE